MLVQAQVVPWWGTGRPAEFSPSGTNPSRARIGGYDYKTESFQRPRVEHYTRFREIRNSNFLVPPPLGVGVFGKLLAARKRKDRQRIGSADPRMLPPVPGTESPREIWLGRSNSPRTRQYTPAQEAQAGQVPTDLNPARTSQPCTPP